MTAAVGADIESLCRKCGDVWHVVVAKVGDDIAKVQCKECGSLHKHRPPGAPAKKAAVTRRRSGGGGSSATTTAAKKSARAAEPPRFEATIEPDLSKPIRPYSIRETFAAGERIDHPKFGIGIVETGAGSGKIQVFFPDGRRVLAQAKEEPRLSSMSKARPAWLRDS